MRKIVAPTLFVCSFGFALLGEVPDTPEDWEALHARALKAWEAHDVPTATTLLTRCRELATTTAERGIAANDLGNVLLSARQFQEARVSLRQAMEIWKTPPGEFVRLAYTSLKLSYADRLVGNYLEAEQVLRSTLDLAPGKQQPLNAAEGEAKAVTLGELGSLLRELGRSAESRSVLLQCAEISGVSWRTRADSTAVVAGLDQDAHRWKESITGWEAVAAIGRAHEDSALEAVAARGLGQIWLERGDLARSEPLLRSALVSFEAESGGNDLQIATTMTCIGQLYIATNKLAMAEEAFNKALGVEERTLGEAHPQIAIVHEMLGDMQARWNHMEQAREHFRRALTILSAAFGEQSTEAGASLASWGLVEERAHNQARAAELYKKSLGAIGAGSESKPEIGNLELFILRHYALTLKAIHQKDEANAVLAQVKRFQVKSQK